MNADVSTGRYHLMMMMMRALGDGTSNSERLAAWKEDILLGGLGDVMVLGRLSCRV